MIKHFWVKNFLSIRDKQSLDFSAKGPASELVAEVQEGVFLYKLGILFGANASGKTNILLAINEIFQLLVMPKSDALKPIINYFPHLLTKNNPTEMGVTFYANEVKYEYYVRYSRQYILDEELYYYPRGSKSLFYERHFVADNVQTDIKFGNSLKLLARTQESIRENTLNNHSVLSVCRKSAFKEDITPFNTLCDWVMANYHDVDGDGSDKGLVEILKEAYNDERKKKFFKAMLQKADLNISDFYPVIRDVVIPQDNKTQIRQTKWSNSLKDELYKPTDESISFVNAYSEGSFDVSLSFQSNGTRKFISILDVLYDMVTGNHVYYLDELGEDLHFDLLYYYLNVFLYNSRKSQLIITSQETSLLLQDLINDNRGVVWFVEKNKDTASSEYSRADSYGLHKNLSLYNSYRIGRLGAKPELGSFFIDLED